MHKVLLVDGGNIIKRAASGDKVPPVHAIPLAAGIIARVAKQILADSVIVALDSGVQTLRSASNPDYKANRTSDNRPYFDLAYEVWKDGKANFGARKSAVERIDGYEADDIIFTAAKTISHYGKSTGYVLSCDSDFAGLVSDSIKLLLPLYGSKFISVLRSDVCLKYGIKSVAHLTHFKALTGEKGDNIAGVPGIGPVKASKLLDAYGNLEGIITAGGTGACKYSEVVYNNREIAREAFRLLTPYLDAPLNPSTYSLL